MMETPGNSGEQAKAKIEQEKLDEVKREVRDFFCLKPDDQVPDPKINFVFSREEMNRILGRETEDYVAASSRPEGLYFIDQSVIEEITPHKKGHFEEVLRHEMNHWYYSHITGVSGKPRWLTEGLANQFAGMRTYLPEPTEDSLAEKYFRFTEDQTYRWGNLMAHELLSDYGNEKIVALLRKFNGEITKERFDQLFEETFGITMVEFEKRVKAINDEKWKKAKEKNNK